MTTPLAAGFVLQTLREKGFEAFLVGGCVRDILLGRNPKDYDVTTNATPEQVQDAFEKTLPVGAAFGVIVVMVEGIQIEVATYRTDGQYSDNRRPDSVAYSASAKEDVQRRDFTINGLLMLPAHDVLLGNNANYTNNGVVDYVGGQKDIEKRLIRCIGDPRARFGEDALRMLRAVRFAAQLGFEIDGKTLDAITELAYTIRKVSRERVAAEMLKLVSSPYPIKGLVPLVTTGLSRYILPPMDFFDRTLHLFAKFPTKDPLKGLAMLMEETHTEMADTFYADMKLSNEQKAILENARNPKIGNLDCLTLAELKKLARRPGIQMGIDMFEDEVTLDGDTLNPEMAAAVRLMRNFTPEDIRPRPFLTGDDLIAMGMKPGPEFRRILDDLETYQLNGEIKSREDAEARLKFVWVAGEGV